MHRRLPRTLALAALLLGLLSLPFLQRARPADPAEAAFARAWELARASGSYGYRSEVAQTSYPAVSLSGAGRAPRTDALTLEGTIDQLRERMELTVMQQDQPATATALKAEGGRVFRRDGLGAWVPADDVNLGLAAPGGDPLAFLGGASAVTDAGRDEALGYHGYGFTLDGVSFAAAMGDRLQDQLRRSEKIPSGLSVDVAAAYRGMSGQGTLWVDDDGLPRRMALSIHLPAASDGSRADAEIVSTYFDFDRGRLALASTAFWETPAGWLSFRLERSAGALRAAGLNLAVILALLLAAAQMVRVWRSRRFYVGVVSVVILSMLGTPLAQAEEMAAFAQGQDERQASQREQQQQQQSLAAGRAAVERRDWQPHQDPMAAGAAEPAAGQTDQGLSDLLMARPELALPGLQATAAVTSTDSDNDGLSDIDEAIWGSCPRSGQSTGDCAGVANPADSDGDGLSDGTEVNSLGILPDEWDSDGDTITDTLEVKGFAYRGQQWYLDPYQDDTNGDGLSDGAECAVWTRSSSAFNPNAVCPDTDGDGTPNLFDLDNDNDSVNDAADSSPNGVSQVFDAANPLQLTINNLQLNKPVYVDFVVRPTDATHLNYSSVVLDWPTGDTKGQIQRRLDTTFATTAKTALRGTDAQAANGDIRMVPMLEITMPYQSGHYANLPRKAPYTSGDRTAGVTVDKWLDKTTLSNYNISVKDVDSTSGNLKTYVPLAAMSDESGGGRAAFSARMRYYPTQGSNGVAAWGSAQQVRMVWMVQMLSDQCVTAGADEATCAREDTLTVIHTYDEAWTLTGLNVTEDHGLKVGIVYEDPTRETESERALDNQLWMASWNLNKTFLRGRDCDSMTNGVCTSNGARDVTVNNLATAFNTWAGGAAKHNLAVRTFDYTDQTKLATIVMTETKQLLSDVFTTYAAQTNPTLLYASETAGRSLNLDDMGVSGTQYTLNMSSAAAPLQVSTNLKWAPYRLVSGVWQNYDFTEYIELLKTKLVNDTFFQAASNSATGLSEQRGKLIWAQSYYGALLNGTGGLVESAGTLTWKPEVGDLPESVYAASWPASTFDGFTFLSTAFLKMIAVEFSQAGGATFWLKLEGAFTTAYTQYSFGFAKIFKNVKSIAMFGVIGLSMLGVATGAIMFAIGYFTGNEQLLKVSLYILNGLTLVVVGLYLANLLYTGYKLYKATQPLAKLALAAQFAKFEAVGIVGLALGVGIAVAMFLIQHGSEVWGAMVSGEASISFLAGLAYMIASIIVLLILFVIELIPFVGVAVVLLITLIDAILALAGMKGMTDYLTEFIADALYDVDMVITNFDDSSRLSLGFSGRSLVDENMGYVAANSVRYTVDVTNTLKYSGSFSSSDARDTAIHYYLQGSQVDRHDSLVRGSMRNEWQLLSGRRIQERETVSYTARFSDIGPGINRSFDKRLYLTEAYNVAYQGCWMAYGLDVDCTIEEIDGSNHIDLGQSQYFDVLPNTLTEFNAMQWNNYPTTLLTPRQKDRDGDGLLATDDGGADPNDNWFDSDGDGMSDAYELSIGTDARKADTDGDRISDARERQLGTRPTSADSDGDNLDDYTEAVQGWLIGYGVDGNNQPLVTRIWSDPLAADADDDGLTDLQEFTFGFNPKVATDPSVINDLVQIEQPRVTEQSAPQVLLRFEETAPAKSFYDASGRNVATACASSANACPTAGVSGRYGAAITFDGANDAVTLPRTIADDFTIGFWMKTTQASGASSDWRYSSGLVDNSLVGNVNQFGISMGDNGKILFGVNIAGGALTTIKGGSVADGAWHYVAATRAKSTGALTLYVDGAQVASGVGGTASLNSLPLLTLGTRSTGGYAYAGSMDELAIYDRVLTAAEINAIKDGRYNPNDRILSPGASLTYSASVTNTLLSQGAHGMLSADTGIIDPAVAEPEFALRFEPDDRRSSFVDQVTGARFATCAGSVCPASEVINGTDRALRFDGADDSLVVPALMDHIGETNYYLSFNLKLRSLPAAGKTMAIFSTDGSADKDIDISVNSSGKLVVSVAGATPIYYLYYPNPGNTSNAGGYPTSTGPHVSNFSLSGMLNTWVSLKVAFAPWSTTIYINGGQESVLQFSSQSHYNKRLGGGRIGNSSDGASPLAGSLNNIELSTPAGGGSNTTVIFGLPFDEGNDFDNGVAAYTGGGSITCDVAASCPTYLSAGVSGEAASFDGVDDYLTINQGGSFANYSGGSVGMYVKLYALPAAGQRMYLLDNTCTGSTRCFDFYIDSDGKLVMEKINGSTGTSMGTVISNFSFSGSLNTWVQVGFDWNVGSISSPAPQYIYVNGALDKSYTGSYGSNTPLVYETGGRIGMARAGGSALKGAIDQFGGNGTGADFNSPKLEVSQLSRVTGGRAATCASHLTCPTATGGKYGSALLFDGVDDYMAGESSDFATGDYTVGMWFKSSAATQQDLLSATSAGAHGVLLELQADGRLRWLHRFPTNAAGSSIISTAAYNNGAWHYLTAVRAGASMTLYVNGAVVGTATAAQNASGPLALTLGRLGPSNADRFFKGSLDELTIIPAAVDSRGVSLLRSSTYPAIAIPADFVPFSLGARSSITASGTATVNTPMVSSRHRFDQEAEAAIDLQSDISYPVSDPNATNLKLFMPFEEVPGSTSFANLGNSSFTKAYCSGSDCPAAGLRGVADRAVYFDGSGDRISLNSGECCLGGGAVAVWVKGDRGTIVDFRTSDYQSGLQLAFNRLRYTFYGNVNTYHHHEMPISLPENQWTHVALTFDSNNTAYVFVNGALAGTMGIPTNLRTEFVGPTIGATGGRKGDSFHGYMDDLRAYNITLTANQIKAIYQQSAPIMRFEFDEDSSASTFADSSVNAYIGTPASTVCNAFEVNSIVATDFQHPNRLLQVSLGSTGEVLAQTALFPAVGSSHPAGGSVVLCRPDTLIFQYRNEDHDAFTLDTQVLSPSLKGAVQMTSAPVDGKPRVTINATWGAPQTKYDPPAGSDGKIGNVATFDGAGLITVQNPTAVNALTSTLTIMGWIKPNSLLGTQDILGSSQDLSANGLIFGTVNGKLRLNAAGVQDYVSNVGLKANVWQHVAVVLDGSYKASFYVDGVFKQSITGSQPARANSDDAFYIGAGANAAGTLQNYLDADLDELAVYQRAMGAAEVYSAYLRELRWYRATSTAELIVDSDAPVVTLLTDKRYRPNAAANLAVSTVDASSSVRLLDMGIWAPNTPTFVWSNAPVCAESATTNASWCPAFNPAALGGAGVYMVQFRAVDAVGNEGYSPAYTILVDAGAPTASSAYNQTKRQLTADPGDPQRWTLALSGAISDPTLGSGVVGSGVSTSTVTISLYDAVGNLAGIGQAQPATVSGATWSIDYAFVGSRPTGAYTIKLSAQDAVGNALIGATVGSVLLDSRAPSVEVDRRVLPAHLIGSTQAISGFVSEAPDWGRELVNLHFEEAGAATAFYDSSASGVAVGCAASACPGAVSGVFGQARAFDGVNDSLTVPPTTTLDVSAATLAAWIKPGWAAGAPGYNPAILGLRGPGGARFSWHINKNYGAMELWNGSAVGSVPVALSRDQWYHVALVQSGGSWTGYLNGAPVGTVTQAFGAATGQALNIGSSTGGAEFFPGALDEVQVYGRALSAAEVYALAQRQVAGVSDVQVWLQPVDFTTVFTASAARYDFEETPGAYRFSDGSGHGATATCRVPASAGDCPSAVAGRFGQALSFDGGDVLETGSGVAELDTFALSAWIKTTATRAGILTKSDGDATWEAGEKSFYLDASGRPTFVGWGNEYIRSTVAVNDNAWHHVVVAWDKDSGAGMIAVDGSDFTDRQALTYAPNNSDNAGDIFRIGAGNASPGEAPNNFTGLIDRVVIDDRTLSSQELAALASAADAGTWQSATVSQSGAGLSRWSYSVPAGVENFYQIHLRGADANANVDSAQTAWRGAIDTLAPRLTAAATWLGSGAASQTEYRWSVDDRFLDPARLGQPCAGSVTYVYRSDPAGIAGASAVCRVAGHIPTPVTFSACDAANHCVTQTLTPTAAANPANVSIVSPVNDSTLPAGAWATVSGAAYDPDGLKQVELFANNEYVGTFTFPSSAPEQSWSLNWTPGAPGDYTLVARLTDTLDQQVSDSIVVTARQAYALTVARAGTGTGSVASAPAGIDCGATCSQMFVASTVVTLTATPVAGSTFAGWSGACSGTSACVVTMGQARSVTATFTRIQYALTIAKAGNGTGSVAGTPGPISCGATCSASFASGTAVTLKATAGPNSTFTGWSGVACSGTGQCVVTMDQARTVTATFALVKHTLTASTSGDGAGSVSSDPAGIDCGEDCSQSYDFATPVTLTANAASGSTFAGWSGDCSGTDPCVVTMIQARGVTATFVKDRFLLSVTRGGDGAGSVSSDPAGIDCGEDCSESYLLDTSVTLTATPAANSTFAGWSGACSGTGACVVSAQQAGEVAVTATFTMNQHALTVSRSGSGAGGVSSDPAGIDCGEDCSESYAEGSLVTLTATAASGSTFAGWSGACSDSGPCVVTMDQARSVTATFTSNQHTLTVVTQGAGPGYVTSDPAGINCAQDCSESYPAGTQVTLTAVPVSNGVFNGWSGDCSGTGPCVVTMDQARTVTATFAPREKAVLGVGFDGEGDGSVLIMPVNVTCTPLSTGCIIIVDPGTVLTLTATPSAGSTFLGWSGACSGAAVCQVTMDETRSVTAQFGKRHMVYIPRMIR